MIDDLLPVLDNLRSTSFFDALPDAGPVKRYTSNTPLTAGVPFFHLFATAMGADVVVVAIDIGTATTDV